MNNAYLAHHGILGMKWGVRRSEAQLARARGHSSKPSDDKHEVAARKVAVKNRRTMSDSDLKKRIERLKLEREFKNLTEDDIAPVRNSFCIRKESVDYGCGWSNDLRCQDCNDKRIQS